MSVELPRGGRRGVSPECPYSLGVAGCAWWRWAWGTPQSARWDGGVLWLAARRAGLEDALAALDAFDPASGGMVVLREMRELDDRLGLSPRAMVALGWVVEPEVVRRDGLDVLSAKRAERLAAGGRRSDSAGPVGP